MASEINSVDSFRKSFIWKIIRNLNSSVPIAKKKQLKCDFSFFFLRSTFTLNPHIYDSIVYARHHVKRAKCFYSSGHKGEISPKATATKGPHEKKKSIAAVCACRIFGVSDCYHFNCVRNQHRIMLCPPSNAKPFFLHRKVDIVFT